MAKQIASFEEFCKMGVSPKAENLADPKDAIVKGSG